MTTDAAPVLRPLGVGERLDAGIKLYLRSLRTLAPALLVVAVPVALLLGALAYWRATAVQVTTPFATRNPFTGQVQFHWSVFDPSLGWLAVTLVAGVVLGVFAKAIAYRHFADAYLGRTASWRHALSGGLAKVGSVLWITIAIEGTAWCASVGVVLLGLALVPLGPVAIVLLVAPSIMLLLFVFWWAIANRLAVPSLMMEGARGVSALRRSMALVRGTWWSVFGTVFLASLLVLVVSSVVNVLVGLLAATELSGAARAFTDSAIESLIATLVFVPFTCAIVTVLTADMRVRKEGLDLALLTDDLAGGTTSTLDFLPAPRPVVRPGQQPGTWPAVPPAGASVPPTAPRPDAQDDPATEVPRSPWPPPPS